MTGLRKVMTGSWEGIVRFMECFVRLKEGIVRFVEGIIRFNGRYRQVCGKVSSGKVSSGLRKGIFRFVEV